MELYLQAEGQLGECMLYNLAEWAKERLPEWLEQSIVERSMPAPAAPADPLAHTAAKEVLLLTLVLTFPGRHTAENTHELHNNKHQAFVPAAG